MEDRHLHFNVISLLWLYIALLVLLAGMTYALNRWQLPGITALHNYAFGHSG